MKNFDEDFYMAPLRTADAVGLAMIPKFRAAQLMAIVYVWGGGDESFTSAMDDCTLPSGFAIGIKASSILQLLGAISTENVRLEFSDPSRPLLLNA